MAKRVFTDEWRRKISEAAKARAQTPEGKALLSRMSKGKSPLAETRQKISDAGKGRVQSEETKAKRVASRQGYSHSEETKRKISTANSGKVRTDETRQKLSAAGKGRPHTLEHIAAQVNARKTNGPWFKIDDIGERISHGKKAAFDALSEPAKEMIRAHARTIGKARQVWSDINCEVCHAVVPGHLKRLRFCSDECKALGLSGAGAPNWQGGKTDESTKQRHSFEAGMWRYLVLHRDELQCQICGTRENLHAHHIKSWSQYPDLRFDLENGITLCIDCHETTHGRSLNGKNTGTYQVQCQCAWCDTVFPREKNRVRDLNYCDRVCSAQHMRVKALLKHYGRAKALA